MGRVHPKRMNLLCPDSAVLSREEKPHAQKTTEEVKSSVSAEIWLGFKVMDGWNTQYVTFLLSGTNCLRLLLCI